MTLLSGVILTSIVHSFYTGTAAASVRSDGIASPVFVYKNNLSPPDCEELENEKRFGTHPLPDDAKVVSFHLLRKETVFYHTYGGFGDFHIPVEYPPHTGADQTYPDTANVLITQYPVKRFCGRRTAFRPPGCPGPSERCPKKDWLCPARYP